MLRFRKVQPALANFRNGARPAVTVGNLKSVSSLLLKINRHIEASILLGETQMLGCSIP